MNVQATVTDVLTEGYIEVAVWEDGAPTKRREIAELPKKKKARRGDIVELAPHQPRDDKIARIVYIGPVIFFLFGVLFTKNFSWPDRLLTGAILALLTFVIAWLMNRRARLRRRMAWRVTSVDKEADHLL